MYGKWFKSTYSGSMYGAGPVVFAVWGYVVANTNVDHTVELNENVIGSTLGCSPEEVLAALEILQAPDPRSRSKAHEGRRILRTGEYMYLVVNHELYAGVKNAKQLREKDAKRKREGRKKEKEQGDVRVSPGDVQVCPCETSTHIDIDIEFPADAEDLAGEGEIVASASNSPPAQGEYQFKQDDSWLESEPGDDIDEFISQCLSDPPKQSTAAQSSEQGWPDDEPLTDDEWVQIVFETHNYLAQEHHQASTNNNNLITLTWDQLQESSMSEGEVEVLRHIAEVALNNNIDPVRFTQFYFEKFHNSNNAKLKKTSKGDLSGLAGAGFPSRKWMVKNHEQLLNRLLDNPEWTSRLYTSPEEVVEVCYG